jgi:hypothetical protein
MYYGEPMSRLVALHNSARELTTGLAHASDQVSTDELGRGREKGVRDGHLVSEVNGGTTSAVINTDREALWTRSTGSGPTTSPRPHRAAGTAAAGVEPAAGRYRRGAGSGVDTLYADRTTN